MELARFSDSGATPDNPDQRIQEDLNLFTTLQRVAHRWACSTPLVTLVSFVGILWTLSGGFVFSLGGSNYEIARLHGVGRGGLLRRRQRAHALHRPPADPAELPAAALRGRLPPPPGAGARVQRGHRPGQGRGGRARPPGPALRHGAGQLPAADQGAEEPDLVHHLLRPGRASCSPSWWPRRASSAARSSWAS